MRAWMQRLSARPHHIGTAYDQENAEWILARFREWGLDAQIETFEVLFPTPKARMVELVEPTTSQVAPASSSNSTGVPTTRARPSAIMLSLTSVYAAAESTI